MEPEEAANISTWVLGAGYIVKGGYFDKLKQASATWWPSRVWGRSSVVAVAYMAGYINGARDQKAKWRKKHGKK